METISNSSRKRNPPYKTKNQWSLGLIKSMKDSKLIVFEDELVVVIKDAYPKAKFHYLVCPKEDIPAIRNVKFKHLELLKHMHNVGENLSNKHDKSNFLIGYHSIPSMQRLHLHVISDDFDSPCLKTKKHWNSFNTEFFLSSEKLIRELETSGQIDFKEISESKVFISQPLKCHKCEYSPKGLPGLKNHLKTHL